MGRRPAALLASVAALAAAFCAGFLAGRGPGAGPAAPTAADEEVAGPSAPRPVDPGLAAAPRDARAPSRAAPAPTGPPDVAAGPAPSPGSSPVAAATTAATVLPAAYATVAVRVLRANGLPASGVRVRLRRSAAGAPSGDDAAPLLQTDGEGRAAFEVLGGGPFDVDARGEGLEAARAAGVRAADDRPTEVELRLPRMVDVAFRAEGLPAGSTWQLLLRATPDAGAAGPASEAAEWQGASAAPTLRARLPEGVPVTARGWASWPAGGASCDPFPVVVAAEVAVPFRPRTPPPRESWTDLTLVLVPDATEGTLPPRGSAVVDTLLVVDGHLRKQRAETIAWQPGDADDRHAVSVGVPSGGTGTYRWQARGSPADEVALPDLPPGGRATVRARVRIAPASVLVGYGDVVVEDARGAPLVPSDVRAVWAFTGDAEAGAANSADELGRLVRDLRTGALTLATDAWHVSRAVAASATGPTRVRVELGGYLVVHLPRPPPRGAGALTVRRTDGGWLGVREEALPPAGAAGVPEGYSAGAVDNGTVLGPLPAGPVELAVALGDAPLGVVTATVVAGEVSVLTLR